MAKPSALMAVATTSGGSRCETTRLQTTKMASPTTAPKISTLPRSGHAPGVPSPPPATFSARMPTTASATPAVRAGLQRSPRTTTASVAATAGVVLVTIPPSAALVNASP